MSSIAAEHPRALPKVPARNGWGFIAAGVCLLALFSVVAMRPLAGPAPAQDGAVAGGLPVTPKLAALAQSDPGRSRRGDRPARPGRVRGDRTLVRADRAAATPASRSG